MDIDTGDHPSCPPPICQKPYTLALKHYEWVQKEVDQLEQTEIITKSMSPWASPIVIVPKKSAPDKPPRRHMSIDFQRLNVLQSAVVKVDSKAKGNLMLDPLPKIDKLYVKLGGAKIFSALDLTSGFITLSWVQHHEQKWHLSHLLVTGYFRSTERVKPFCYGVFERHHHIQSD